jgi:1-deoxy-D-xylulose-5-phosphate reductoisomerase
LREGGTLPAAMNAANEEAVAAFLNERIGLTEIPQVIEAVMNQHSNQPASDIQTVLAADHQARHEAGKIISHKKAQKAQNNLVDETHVIQ